MMDGDGVRSIFDKQTALRISRLELDIDDLRAENARLKASIVQRQDEILRLNEAEAALLAELSSLGYLPNLDDPEMAN